nr:hypothetical protein BaRGS_024314 [Batillaria attramentaria]
MDVIGQRLASRETGTRHGKGYSVFYIYYYPAGIVEGGKSLDAGTFLPTYTVSNYYDVTLGIRDPDIFTPPTECITVRSTADLSVDLIGQRLVSRESGVRYGKEYSVFYLYYYPANTLYLLQDGVCRTRQLTGNISDFCLNYPYQYVKEYLREALGSFDANVWCGGIRGERDGIGVFSSFTMDAPVPTIEEKQGVMDGVPTYTVSNYYNVTLGIRDPSVFTPPEICVTAQKLKV